MWAGPHLAWYEAAHLVDDVHYPQADAHGCGGGVNVGTHMGTPVKTRMGNPVQIVPEAGLAMQELLKAIQGGSVPAGTTISPPRVSTTTFSNSAP